MNAEVKSYDELNQEQRRVLVTDDMLEDTRALRYGIGIISAVDGAYKGYLLAQAVRGVTAPVMAKYIIWHALLHGIYTYGLCTLGAEAAIQIQAASLRNRIKNYWKKRNAARKASEAATG